MTHPTDEARIPSALQGDGSARGAVARGLGRSYGDAAQLEGGTVVDATRLRAIGPVHVSGARATVDVGAGVSLGDLARRVAALGWLPPVLPGTRHVTVGGAIAADVHGKNHQRDGGFGGTVRSFSLVTADGTMLPVTREADRALFEATLGGMGLTGVIASARLELEPLPSGRVRVESKRTRDLDATMASLVEGDQRHHYSVAWLDLSSPRRNARGVVQHGDIAAPLELDEGQRAPSFTPRRALPAPPFPGRGIVRTPVVRSFNLAYWVRPRRGSALLPLASFFHPLDRLSGWPRLYGASGLLQYQCVVPDGQERVLAALVEAFTRGPATPALAVLKRLGPQGEGMLSFPMQGWTLAVDLPAHDAEVYLMLDRMDQVVAEAGGRVYLAKDARLRPDVVGAMYPRLAEWRDVKARVDPEVRFRSDLAERIGIVAARSRATTGG